MKKSLELWRLQVTQLVIFVCLAGSQIARADEGQLLTGDELRTTLSGHTLRGTDWVEYYEPSGIIRGKARFFGVRSYVGRWSIQGNRVCYDYEGTSYDTCSQLRMRGEQVLHFNLNGNLKNDGIASRSAGNSLASF